MEKICKHCREEFEITHEDEEFYRKIDVPAPTLCSDCRNVRRMIFRNERHLYQRKCDLCNKSFLSIYEPNVLFPVYCYDCWWGDSWDALSYGKDYIQDKSFFSQIGELFNKVPHLGIVTGYCENCDYANFTNYSKNCYLVFGCHAAENCYYGWRMHDGLECVDCLQIDKSKYCYECVDCDECYELFFSQDCGYCQNSLFLYDCKGCAECVFCAGLRNKQYCILNKQFSKEEYLKEKQKLNLGSQKKIQEAQKWFQNFLADYPRKNLFLLNSENVKGDHILNSKNVRSGFNLKDVYDGAYLESCENLKDAMDCTFCGWPAELNYEGISAGCVNAYNTKFSSTSWSCTNIEYCESCHHSKELFGCVGLRKKYEYCIFNKQYSKEEYSKLKEKIVAEMRGSGEYGEFFPVMFSPFAYNETIANEYFPLKKENAVKAGYKWKDENPKDYLAQKYLVPDDIKYISDDITKEILACESCGKNYKIILAELEFYRKFGLPIPSKCFSCRHNLRFAKRNARKLWQIKCDKCDKEMLSTYSTKRSEKVYCEECYMKEVY